MTDSWPEAPTAPKSPPLAASFPESRQHKSLSKSGLLSSQMSTQVSTLLPPASDGAELLMASETTDGENLVSPKLNASNAWPHPEEDRRKVDRRQNDRGGKYDRRRNRCARCKHFAPPQEEGEILGECQAHHSPMAAAAYACPIFEPLSSLF
jgi:hypothetical protein